MTSDLFSSFYLNWYLSILFVSAGISRKPVYLMGAERCKWKLCDFHRSLKERGMVRPFTGLENVSKLNETH